MGAFWTRVGIEPSIANTVLLFILAMLCHAKWNKIMRASDFLLYFIIVLFYFASSIIYPVSSEVVISKAFDVLLVSVPFLFVGIVFKNDEYKEWILLLSRLAIIINIVFSFLSSSPETVIEEDMHRAYMLLPSVLYILAQIFERFNFIDK